MYVEWAFFEKLFFVTVDKTHLCTTLAFEICFADECLKSVFETVCCDVSLLRRRLATQELKRTAGTNDS